MASSPFWWPEECKKEESMSLHRKQTDIFQLLRGFLFLPTHTYLSRPNHQHAIISFVGEVFVQTV